MTCDESSVSPAIDSQGRTPTPMISVVIPSYRSEETLPYVLDSLARQSFQSFETLIVNRGGVNNLEKMCSEYGFCTVYRLDTERTSAVNFGASKSKGDFIYYLGSDYLLQGNLLGEAIRTIRQEKVDAIVVPNLIDESQGYWAKVRNLEKRAFKGDDRLEACRFIRKDVFFKLGGYDTKLVAYEEHDLHCRLVKAGFKVGWLENSSELIIGEPQSLAAYVRKFYYYGSTIGEYMKKHPGESGRRLSPFRFLFAKNRRVFLDNPSLTTGFFVFQFYRYIGAVLGMFSTMVRHSSEIKND